MRWSESDPSLASTALYLNVKGGRLIVVMMRKDLLKRLKQIAKSQNRSLRITEGGSHTRVQIGQHVDYVPRHNEVNEITAKAIIKRAEAQK